MEYLQTQGISLPRLGLGTFRMQGDACRTAVESALGLGYRHLDTAEMYGNEEPIGAAIAGSPWLSSHRCNALASISLDLILICPAARGQAIQ